MDLSCSQGSCWCWDLDKSESSAPAPAAWWAVLDWVLLGFWALFGFRFEALF